MRWFHVVALVVVFAMTTDTRADVPTTLQFPPRAPEPVLLGIMVRPPPCEYGFNRNGSCSAAKTSTARRALATTITATIPGFLVRGVGSYFTNDTATAKRLLWMQGIGVGMMLVGGLPIGISGGNPYLLIPFAPLLVSGAGLFMQSWMADIYNAARQEPTGTPTARPPWSLDIGGLWVHDAYRDRALARIGARVVQDRLDVTATAYIDHRDTYRAGDLGARVRLLGMIVPTGGGVTNGSYLDVRAIGRVRDDSEDRVQVQTVEAELLGRLDLVWVSNQLDGSFAELSTGGGIERAAFSTASEKGGLLLGRFAFGAYLGERGEAQVFYDHRRDSFAGGIAAWRAAGFVGSVGAMLDAPIGGRWRVHAELEIGSAWVTSLGLRYQGGEP